MFEPVEKKSVVDTIISSLLEMVVRGELRPGEALPSERELSNIFNVSRSSVRGALKVLQDNGIVVVRPGLGAFLTEEALTGTASLAYDEEATFMRYQSAYKQVVEARSLLEVEMAGLAAERATPENITEMEDSCERMTMFLASGAHEAFVLEGHGFHSTIARSCGNDYLYKAYSLLLQDILSLARLGDYFPERHDEDNHQHIMIYEAIKAGDKETARAIMKQHMDFCAQNSKMYFDKVKKGEITAKEK